MYVWHQAYWSMIFASDLLPFLCRSMMIAFSQYVGIFCVNSSFNIIAFTFREQDFFKRGPFLLTQPVQLRFIELCVNEE